MDFNVLFDNRVNVKESKKRDKYQDNPKELKKKLWNMKVTVLSIVIGTFDTVTKELVERLKDLEIRGRVETLQITSLLKASQNTEESPRDLRRRAVT